MLGFSLAELFSIALIIIWAVMCLSAKYPRVLIWIFMLSNYLVYFEAFLLQNKYPLYEMRILTLIILVLVSTAVLVIKFVLTKSKKEFFCLQNNIYLVYAAFNSVFIAFYFFIKSVDFSFLALQH